ncbi:hypothetical protein LCGC14_3129990, partial [marine sediment metagenome]
LNLDLPSAQFDNFLSRSSSLSQVIAGVGAGPGVYLSPATTVLSPSGITSGLARPGSAVPRTAYLRPTQARQLMDAAVQVYKPIFPELSRQLRVSGKVEMTLAERLSASGQTLSPVPPAMLGAVRPTASALFGVLREQADQQRLAEELAEAEQGRRRKSEDWSAKAQVKAGVEAEGRGPIPPAPEAGPIPPAGSAAEAQAAGAGDLRGRDIFLDILILYNQMQKELRTSPLPAPKGETPQGQPPLRAAPGETPEQEQTRYDIGQDRKVVERLRDRLMVHALAGQSSDLFNLHMKKGERSLSRGKYYAAADIYKLASILNSTNPLAYIGGALARFAAREPMT